MRKDPMEYMCTHYLPLGGKNNQCKAGVEYNFPPLKPLHFPCFGKNVERCEQRLSYTEEEIKEDQLKTEKILAMVNKGISPCCNAPLDMSQVIKGGTHDGHGPRFCSKCRKWVCTV